VRGRRPMPKRQEPDLLHTNDILLCATASSAPVSSSIQALAESGFDHEMVSENSSGL
jgi:hypothetical protein